MASDSAWKVEGKAGDNQRQCVELMTNLLIEIVDCFRQALEGALSVYRLKSNFFIDKSDYW